MVWPKKAAACHADPKPHVISAQHLRNCIDAIEKLFLQKTSQSSPYQIQCITTWVVKTMSQSIIFSGTLKRGGGGTIGLAFFKASEKWLHIEIWLYFYPFTERIISGKFPCLLHLISEIAGQRNSTTLFPQSLSTFQQLSLNSLSCHEPHTHTVFCGAKRSPEVIGKGSALGQVAKEWIGAQKQ